MGALTVGRPPAEKVGLFCLVLALALWYPAPSPLWTLIPLSAYLLLCLTAPFIRGFGFFLPIISKGKTIDGIALTFDDGPSPESTPVLLGLLRNHGLQATFFVVGERVRRHPQLLLDIVAHGHTIGQHSYGHDIFFATRSEKRMAADLAKTGCVLEGLGVRTHVFRPPVGITSPRMAKPLARAGLVAVNFSCSARDRGNRNINHLARKIQQRLHPGAIVMLHDLPPFDPAKRELWQKELDQLFRHMVYHYNVIPLEKLIHHPVSSILVAPGHNIP